MSRLGVVEPRVFHRFYAGIHSATMLSGKPAIYGKRCVDLIARGKQRLWKNWIDEIPKSVVADDPSITKHVIADSRNPSSDVNASFCSAAAEVKQATDTSNH